jgi:hypothetical protein
MTIRRAATQQDCAADAAQRLRPILLGPRTPSTHQRTPRRSHGLGGVFSVAMGRLPPALQLFYGQRPLRARGSFRCERGRGWYGGLVAMLVGVPPEGSDVPTSLEVVAEAGGERWTRRFGNYTVTSKKVVLPTGHVAERIGSIELRLSPHVDRRALVLRLEAASIWIGQTRVPLPYCIVPSVTVRVEAFDQYYQVGIDVTHRLFGCVGRFVGTMNIVE